MKNAREGGEIKRGWGGVGWGVVSVDVVLDELGLR